MNDAPKPERKRWRVPAPKPRATRPIPTAAPVVSEEADRIAYAQWLVECGMEKSAAAKTAARRDIVSVRRLLDTLRALAEMNGPKAKAAPQPPADPYFDPTRPSIPVDAKIYFAAPPDAPQ